MDINRDRTSRKRILLVEDDPVIARKIEVALTVDGHLVETAINAKECLALLEAAEYDLIITDFKLGGMDGLELAEAIRKERPSLPIVLITAYADQIGDSMGQVSNIDVLLRKPVSVRDLEMALRRIFSGAHAPNAKDGALNGS